ncbi:MAG: class I SAM-dependent methyltransferase [Spirochaetota bacterium]|nr:class I SAM-dependent methyltransferase [Spirochaetota bacterium]
MDTKGIIEPYTAISSVYDHLLKHVDYDSWYYYIRSIMLKHIESPKRILELGCGTGRFGVKFSRDNFLIYGMDKSIDMLRIAKLRAFKGFHIFCGDMTNFHLSKPFDFIFSVHDTMNYLIQYKDIRMVLSSVKKIMHESSVFLFDITTEYNIKKYFDKKTLKYKIKDMGIEWSNKYDAREKLIYSYLKLNKNSGVEVTERHKQRIYTVDEMQGLIEQENFHIIDVFGDYSFSPVKRDTIMINFIIKK